MNHKQNALSDNQWNTIPCASLGGTEQRFCKGVSGWGLWEPFSFRWMVDARDTCFGVGCTGGITVTGIWISMMLSDTENWCPLLGSISVTVIFGYRRHIFGFIWWSLTWRGSQNLITRTWYFNTCRVTIRRCMLNCLVEFFFLCP